MVHLPIAVVLLVYVNTKVISMLPSADIVTLFPERVYVYLAESYTVPLLLNIISAVDELKSISKVP